MFGRSAPLDVRSPLSVGAAAKAAGGGALSGAGFSLLPNIIAKIEGLFSKRDEEGQDGYDKLYAFPACIVYWVLCIGYSTHMFVSLDPSMLVHRSPLAGQRKLQVEELSAEQVSRSYLILSPKLRDSLASETKRILRAPPHHLSAFLSDHST